LLYVLSDKSAFTVSEIPTTFLFQLLSLLFLLSLLISRVKAGLAKKHSTTNVFTVDREIIDATQERQLSREQQATKTDIKQKLWHEMDQAKRDEHIANVCQSSFNIDPPKVSH
jgi:hypothetical protein